MSQKRIYPYIPPELKQALEAEAKRQDRSESYIVAAAIKAYLSPTPIPTQEVKP